jgi:hypothetical protein
VAEKERVKRGKGKDGYGARMAINLFLNFIAGSPLRFFPLNEGGCPS